MARLKLRNYAIGKTGRVFHFLNLSGEPGEDETKFAGFTFCTNNQTENISDSPVYSPSTVFSNDALYNLSGIQRRYASELDPGVVSSHILPPLWESCPNIDIQQIGNYVFSLTKPSPSGTLYNRNTSDSTPTTSEFAVDYYKYKNVSGGMTENPYDFFDDFKYRQWISGQANQTAVVQHYPSGWTETISNIVSNTWPELNISGQYSFNTSNLETYFGNAFFEVLSSTLSADEILGTGQMISEEEFKETTGFLRRMVNRQIYNLNFNIGREKNILGFKDGSDYYVFSKDQNDSGNDEIYIWPKNDMVYGWNEGIPNSYILETNLEKDSVQVSANAFFCYPFKLKNIYDQTWNLDLTGRNETDWEYLNGIRDYTSMGKTQETLWLSYKYKKDYDYDESDSIDSGRNNFLIDPLSRFSFAERIRGVYKYNTQSKHKSNIYSIEIKDSGLHDSFGFYKDSNGNLVELDDFVVIDKDGNEVRRIGRLEARMIIKDMVEKEVKKTLKRIAPKNTQFWDIRWKGK